MNGQVMDSKLLEPEDMRRVSRWRFAPKALVEGYFSGRHRANEQGTSTEFRDYRPYTPGDDPRRVDWRVFARTDRHYLRNYHQETSMNCYILLDSSGSMGFGEGISKLRYASRFAAMLAYLVARSDDKVSLALFDQKVKKFFPLKGTGGHVQQMLGALEKNEPGQDTEVAGALRELEPMCRQRGSLVVLSDFLDEPGPIFEAFNGYLHRGFRIYLYQILAPEELELDDRGLLAFVDMESGRRVTAHTRQIREAYREAMAGQIRAVRDLARRRQIHHALARTDHHPFNLFGPLVEETR
jgi:uncharacterized protein (DUF58 family)